MGVVLLTRGELTPYYYIAFLILTLTVYEPVLTLFTFIVDLLPHPPKRRADQGPV